MVLFYEIIHDLIISVHPTIGPTIHSSRPTRSFTSKNPKFVVPQCKTVTHQRSYIIRTTRIWNHLVELNLNTDSFSSFKSSLFKYYESSLYLCYNGDDPRSYKTICPKCNSVRSLTTSSSCCM